MPVSECRVEIETNNEPELHASVNRIGSVGGTDTDIVYMGLYDSFREQDGEPATMKYLMNCRKMLIAK